MSNSQMQVALNLTKKSFVLGLFKTCRFWFVGLLFIGSIWAIDTSLRPYLLKVTIDRLQHYDQNSNLMRIINPLLLYVLMSLTITLVFRLYDYIHLNLSPLLKRHIGDLLMRRMMQHSLAVFHNNFAGNLATKIKDVMSYMPDLIRILDSRIAVIMGMFVALFTMWTVKYEFALLFLAWLLSFGLITRIFINKARLLSEQQADIRSKTVGQMVDILSNILNVKLFANQKAESQRLHGYLDKYVHAEKRRDWYFFWINLTQGLSFVIYQFICFALLIYWFSLGQVSAGDFALLAMLNIAMINELWNLSKDLLNIADLYSNIVQGLSVVLQPIGLLDKPTAQKLHVTHGDICFENIFFQYNDLAPIFSDKSVTINGRQKVGLVGYSGGGKSTFVNLILRLYAPKAGRILIDGQDIQDVTQNSLHANIAMIPQDPSLFHRSLMENIRYGRLEATDEEVIFAAQQANAHEFIMQLPQQYNSLVGERGVKLSGGQRQRIAIARAILKNAPILILDEATSQLDSVTEQQIQTSLWQAMQNKTVLVIAHRLSTLLHMDRILVFHHGKVIEEGTHAELIQQDGMYKTLWDTQVGGFLADLNSDASS
jgi:ATP-binding cassette subfamily B protein